MTRETNQTSEREWLMGSRTRTTQPIAHGATSEKVASLEARIAALEAGGIEAGATTEERVRLALERAEEAEEMVRVLKRELFWASLHAM